MDYPRENMELVFRLAIQNQSQVEKKLQFHMPSKMLRSMHEVLEALKRGEQITSK